VAYEKGETYLIFVVQLLLVNLSNEIYINTLNDSADFEVLKDVQTDRYRNTALVRSDAPPLNTAKIIK
jgi:hypothetical protein